MGIKREIMLAHKNNFGGTRPYSSIKYIVLHYTANDGDRAESNARYFQSEHRPASSAHYFVDDDTIFQSVPDNYIAWAVGGNLYSDAGKTGGGKLYGKATNANSISIEMCDSRKDGKIQASEQTMENAAMLCRELMEKYGIDTGHVIRHFDVNGKHCPAYMMDERSWADFKERLEKTGFETGRSYISARACYLRKSPGTGDNKVYYGSLSDALKKKCRNKGGIAVFKKEKNFRLVKTRQIGADVWGRMKSGYWVPLKYGGKVRAVPK